MYSPLTYFSCPIFKISCNSLSLGIALSSRVILRGVRPPLLSKDRTHIFENANCWIFWSYFYLHSLERQMLFSLSLLLSLCIGIMPSVRAFVSLRMGTSMSNDKAFGATDCCVRLVGWFREPVGKNCVVRGILCLYSWKKRIVRSSDLIEIRCCLSYDWKYSFDALHPNDTHQHSHHMRQHYQHQWVLSSIVYWQLLVGYSGI